MIKKSETKTSLRTRHRILRTTWLVLTLILIGITIIALYPIQSLSATLLISYILGMVLFVIYEAILIHELYKETPRNKYLIHNALIQIYMGSISLVTASLSFIISAVTRIATETALIIFIGLTLAVVIFSYPIVEELIKNHTK